MTNNALIRLTASAAIGALWSRVKSKNLRRPRAQQAAPTICHDLQLLRRERLNSAWINPAQPPNLGRDARRHDCAKRAQRIDLFYRNPHGGLHRSSPDEYAKIFANTFHVEDMEGFPNCFSILTPA
jgi:hypothetical protein